MVERWHLLFDIGGPEMTVHPRGEFVRYSDYATLEAELAAVKAERDFNRAASQSLARENDLNKRMFHEASRAAETAESRLFEMEKEVERLLAWKTEELKSLAPFATEAGYWAGYDDSEPLVESWPSCPASSLHVSDLRALQEQEERG